MGVALHLDVRSPRAKLRRASKHLADYKAELDRLGNTVNPYDVRVGAVDQTTGQCDVFVTLREIGDSNAAVVLGDYVHNLRSALDHVVTVLGTASGAPIRNQHQFPIFTDKTDYARVVATPGHQVRPRGPLAGLQRGVEIIRQHQPFSYNAAEPATDPLAVLQRFSNGDKHRWLSRVFAIPYGQQQLKANYPQGLLLEPRLTGLKLSLDNEVKVATYVFAPPYPPEVTVEYSFQSTLLPADPAFPPKLPFGQAVTINRLAAIQERVDVIITAVEQL